MIGRARTILIARPTGYGITVTSSGGNPYSAPIRSRLNAGGLRDALIVGVGREHQVECQPARSGVLAADHLGDVG